MRRNVLFAVIPLITLLSACAGPTQNPKERTAALARYEDPQEIAILQEAAARGESWAQLRLGVASELGVDVPIDIPAAVEWYKKAAAHVLIKPESKEALIDKRVYDKPLYSDQTGDALIAHHQLANIYLIGEGVEKNLVLAYLLEKYVANKTKGKNMFYCCGSSGGRFITSSAITATLRSIEGEMTEQQLAEAKAREATWSIRDEL